MPNDLFLKKYRISSARLQHYDYSLSGYYFVTICAWQMLPYFGKIENNKMELSKIGKIVRDQLLKTEKLRRTVRLDEWVIMPNHVHAIIVIDNALRFVETHCNASLHIHNAFSRQHNGNASLRKPPARIPLPERLPWHHEKNKFGPQKNNLPSIIRGFKSSVKRICDKNGEHNFCWQPRYHDHIIRHEYSLRMIRRYIKQNPCQWGGIGIIKNDPY
ncbi:MAG: transposase [Patescibacteria group bacterium]|jgi:REP element-mobilizing transposase RayT